jgi:general stress protein CsbA
MRHVYTRTIIAVIWFIAAVAGLFTANYIMTVVGLMAGFVYLSSANSMRKKEKENK